MMARTFDLTIGGLFVISSINDLNEAVALVEC